MQGPMVTAFWIMPTSAAKPVWEAVIAVKEAVRSPFSRRATNHKFCGCGRGLLLSALSMILYYFVYYFVYLLCILINCTIA